MMQCQEMNYGITGTLIAKTGMSLSNGTSFVERYSAMEDGDIVVVFGGRNDYFWSDVQFYYRPFDVFA